MIKLGIPIFRLTQLSFALEEVILRPYSLTGYLDIDVKKVPLNPAGRFTIPDFLNLVMRLETEINLQFLKQLDHYLILQISCIIYLAKIQNK